MKRLICIFILAFLQLFICVHKTFAQTANENAFTGPENVQKVIYFDFNNYTIKSEFNSVIDSHAQFLRLNPRSRVSIEGHDDGQNSSQEFSLSLGHLRAASVINALLSKGVSPSQFEAISLGSVKPAVAGDEEVARTKNRRVEFFYK